MATNEEPDSFIFFGLIYNDDIDLRNKQKLVFNFQVTYTLAPEVDSDGEEEDLDNVETRTVDQTHEFDKEWLIGGDRKQIIRNVYHILGLIEAPCYYQVVKRLTDEIWTLKEDDACSALRYLERVQVAINVIVWSFPREAVGDVEVKLAVAPASDEAVEHHLETVVVENESYCVVCMDKIRVGSAGRMPCLHVFHRTCGEAWLRSSGICPVCRAVFPS